MFPPSERYYRCYRCFTKFAPDGEPSGDGTKRSMPTSSDPLKESPSIPGESRSRAEIVDTRLELDERGTKYAVETFEVRIKNRSDTPLRVTRITLTFDGDEEKTTPKDELVVPPNQTETADIHWDWIHPDQNSVTIDVRSDGETVATADVTISMP
ncbi:hypothetical protein SAMN04489842_3361 [Natronobacterium texcoconense]|uniref:CARDB protein n=1 Tax=Natronobacterium texcoconense TaxID=1095778 RepID=A0A1H1IAE6_NATTX|nr:hypothetical protein SAMN04489842_3361 [Natronobacterium texcoconense]